MSSFLKSRHKRLLKAILALLIILLLTQSIFSYTLYKHKPKILDYLTETFGYSISIENISFNFLQGLHIKGVHIFYNRKARPPVFIKDAFVRIRILPLILKKAALRIDITEALLLMNREEEGINLQVIFSDIYKKIPEIKFLASAISNNRIDLSIKTAEFFYTGNPYLEKNMHILLKDSRIKQDAEKFNFNTNLEFYYRLPENRVISRLFKDKNIKQKMKCSVEGRINRDDLTMDLISLRIGQDEIIGAGINKGFAERNPYLDITFTRAVISLANIIYTKDNLGAQGYAFFFIKLNGLMNETKIDLNGTLRNCNFKYISPSAETIEVAELNGETGIHNNQLKLNNIYLKINKIPLKIQSTLAISEAPDIALNISLAEDFLTSYDLPLKKLELIFNGRLKKNLEGDLKIDTDYVRKDSDLNMQAYFKNISFDYSNPKEKYFSCEAVELVKDSGYKIQKLNFANLESKIYLNENGIKIKQLNFYGYGSSLSGELSLETKNKASLKFVLEGNGLDVKSLMQDIMISDKLLSGSMDIKVAFDNQQKDFLKGSCYIKKAAADLDILAAIVKLPSLNNVDFDSIKAIFSLSKTAIKVEEIKLLSPDVICEAHWDTNSKIDGLFRLKMAAELLKKSESFRKLINLAKINDPYIEFSFLLGGMPRAVRIMWLKGEFKDRIEQGLPDWIERRIEKDLNKMIDDLAK